MIDQLASSECLPGKIISLLFREKKVPCSNNDDHNDVITVHILTLVARLGNTIAKYAQNQ